MSNPLSGTYETAKNTMESAQDGAEHVVASAKATWWDGVKAVAGIAMMLRSFRADDGLGWVGLMRRRGPLLSAGIFGAGMAVGAGAALLLAPSSGLEMRRGLVDRFAGRASKATVASATRTAETVAAETKNLAVEAAHRAIEHVAAKMPHPADGAATAHNVSASSDGNGRHVA